MRSAHGKLHRVAVYGTLKKNPSNHVFLAGQTYLGEADLTSIVLYDLGWYPAAKLRQSQGVRVEVYEISDETLALLNRLEGFQASAPETGLYRRVQLETPLDPA